MSADEPLPYVRKPIPLREAGLRSGFDGSAVDTADLELATLLECDRDEEQRELFELPHVRPLRRVVAARAGPSLPKAKVLLLGTEAEDDKHHASVRIDSQ